MKTVIGLHVEDQAVPGCRECELRKNKIRIEISQLQRATKIRSAAFTPVQIARGDRYIATAKVEISYARTNMAWHIETEHLTETITRHTTTEGAS